jgi:tetratricopeptide (TPR) repeat protein
MGLFNLSKPPVGGIIKQLHLEDFYNSLSEDEKRKFIQYSGHGDDLIKGKYWTSQSQKHLLWTSGGNANYNKDYSFAILLGKKALVAHGTLVDQHFVYNTLIEAYLRLGDYQNLKKYCMEELEIFPQIGPPLKEDGELPPSIPCRDLLLHTVVDIEKNYQEGQKLLDEFVKVKLLNRKEAEEESKRIKIKQLKEEAESSLKIDDFDMAQSLFRQIIELDNSEAAEIYKHLGNYLMGKSNNEDALQYFKKAIEANPLISGVKSKIESLSKKLGVPVITYTEETLMVIKQKEKKAKEWWAKRDLADEYVKIEQYDSAWRLYDEAVSLCLKDKRPCDTVYSHMAKMREKQKQYNEALFYYLLSYNEFAGETEPPKYIGQGIDKCLTKLGKTQLTHQNFYMTLKKTTDIEQIKKIMNEMIS